MDERFHQLTVFCIQFAIFEYAGYRYHGYSEQETLSLLVGICLFAILEIVSEIGRRGREAARKQRVVPHND
jgi:hypothetical protein